MEACPAALNQVAKSMLGTEASANDLYEALQNGTISFDEMYAAIINLDQNGAEGIASFAEQAKTASGGIETSMNLVKVAITKNLANIIAKLNESGAIVDFFNGIKAAINAIGPVIGEVVSVIFNLISALQPLAPVLLAVAAGFIAFKASLLISTIVGEVTAALQLLHETQTIVTIAQKALNAVMAINPFTLIITAISALVAGFLYL